MKLFFSHLKLHFPIFSILLVYLASLFSQCAFLLSGNPVHRRNLLSTLQNIAACLPAQRFLTPTHLYVHTSAVGRHPNASPRVHLSIYSSSYSSLFLWILNKKFLLFCLSFLCALFRQLFTPLLLYAVSAARRT